MKGFLYNERKFKIKDNNDYTILNNIEDLEFILFDYDDYLDIETATLFFNNLPNTIKYIVIENSNFTSYIDMIERHKQNGFNNDIELEEKINYEFAKHSNNLNKILNNIPSSIKYIFLNYHESYNLKKLPFNCKITNQMDQDYYNIITKVRFF